MPAIPDNVSGVNSRCWVQAYVSRKFESTLIFAYICRLGPFFWVENFDFHFLEVFRKNNIFLWV